MINSKIWVSFLCWLYFSSSLVAVVQSRPHGPTTPEITWSECPGFTNTTKIDCGEIKVPLAYFNTMHGSYKDIDLNKALQSNETITLGIARLKATGSKRLGSLTFNPGGPGGLASAVLMVQANGEDHPFANTLTEHYDIIGFDPRGVGLSTPIKCDPDLWNEPANVFPQTEDELNALIARNKKIGESCAELTGPLIYHLDTVHAAYDLELMRRALDDGKLNLLGLSWATQLGSQYAEFFPENGGRMVLDGNLNHAQSQVDWVATEVVSYERTLEYFFQWCSKNKSCALHGKDDLPSLFDKLVNDANQKPIPAPECQKSKLCRPYVTGLDVLAVTQNYVVFVNSTLLDPNSTWINLSKALLNATNGDASGTSYPNVNSEIDGVYAQTAFGCQDWLHTFESATDSSELITLLGILAPHTRGWSTSLMDEMTCLGWPSPVSNPQHLLNERAKSAPPMLMVNAYYDPSTSIQWANGLKEQLPRGTSLVMRNGAGHTSWILNGETTEAINEYFVTGKLPADGTVYGS